MKRSRSSERCQHAAASANVLVNAGHRQQQQQERADFGEKHRSVRQNHVNAVLKRKKAGDEKTDEVDDAGFLEGPEQAIVGHIAEGDQQNQSEQGIAAMAAATAHPTGKAEGLNSDHTLDGFRIFIHVGVLIELALFPKLEDLKEQLGEETRRVGNLSQKKSDQDEPAVLPTD